MTSSNSNFKYWSLFYEDEGFDITGNKIMGRQAAGWSYLKALIKNTNYLSIYLRNIKNKNLLLEKIKPLLDKDKELSLNLINYLEPQKSSNCGGIFYPSPGISNLSSNRSYHGHDAYSIVGITHTTASHNVMSDIAKLAFSNVMPWDAVICTSESVLDTVNKILNHQYDRMSSKFSIKNIVYPKFPVIPLGIDTDEFNFSDDFVINSRKDLNIGTDDIVIVYVGRLSFHAKAHHLPMYLALEQCSKELKNNQKIHIIQTGWFPNDPVRDIFINEGKKICPSINFHFLDGTDQHNKHKTLAAGDIFISLSDNIQETFGITPLEGMASQLPVIVSDWNGYKSTVRNDLDGYRVKTYALQPGLGEDLAYNHMMDSINYDHYIGMSVQRVAIDVSDCIQKLKILIFDKNKRLEYGKNAKKRAHDFFNWPVILGQYRELSKELTNIRNTEKDNFIKFNEKSLPSDRLDPFYIFSSYPTDTLNREQNFTKLDEVNPIPIKDLLKFGSINYSKNFLPSDGDINIILKLFDKYNYLNLEKIMTITNFDETKTYKILIFLLKYGYLTISGEESE